MDSVRTNHPKSNENNAHDNENNIVYESPSSVIIRRQINDEDKSDVDFIAGTRIEGMEVAVKCLTHPHPSHDDVSYLNNEYHILTKYLANCNSSARKAIGRTVEKPDSQKPSQNAVYFEWIEGITLQDLMDQWLLGSDSDETPFCGGDILLVRLLREIALALAEIHEAGVIHNDIAADNIIVNLGTTADAKEDKPNDNFLISVSAKIIDFGYASTIAMAETNDSGETVNDDLYNLGVIYRDILLAVYRSVPTRSSLTRRSIRRIGDGILSESVPESLHTVVSCLTNCETDDALSNPPYKSANEVVEDLNQMLDDPDIFLYVRHQQSRHIPDLVFKCDKIYGRFEELQRLLNTYNQVCHDRNTADTDNEMCPDLVLVAGYGGSGKTTFVESLQDPVIKSGGYFVTGKFDVHQRNVPFSALINALSDLFCAILASDGNTVEKTRKKIMSSVGSEHTMLTDLIPNLSKIIDGHEKEASLRNSVDVFVAGTNAQNKLNFAFRRLMRAVATYEHPLVMILDDLQWADVASLNLVQNIVTDSENKSPILFVGCYRDNEVSEDHPLLTTIHEIEKLRFSSNKKIDVIKIDNLNQEDVNMMVSDVLLTKRRVTRKTFTDLVYQKTRGNPLFCVQFLKSLVEERLLFYHLESKRWRWDEDGINEKTLSNSVADFLTHKITTRLSENARNTLKLAACIGSTFEVETLTMVVDAFEREYFCGDFDEMKVQSDYSSLHVDDILKTLDELVHEGLLEEVGPRIEYKFAHDRIHQAAYTSIAEAERPAMHHQIGELMWNMLNVTENQQGTKNNNGSLMLFRLTDQLNRGSSLITDEPKKISLARLNLRVGEICMKKSAFQAALTHVEAGISLIDQGYSWQEHYDLILRLYNVAAGAQYSTGKYNGISKLLDNIFAHANSFDDKLNAYSIQILILGTQGKGDDAIRVGLDALAVMGERFPTSISKLTVVFEMTKTRRMLQKKSEPDLLELPLMTDKIKIAAMQFLGALVMECVGSKPLLLPLVTCRMVRLSVSYGLCETSAFSFALFGYILCNRLDKTKEGNKYGQLALSLVKRHDQKEWLAKVYASVFAGISYWSEDYKSCTEQFLDGRKTGMEVGDIEYADFCALQAIRESLFCGDSLALAEKRARMFCHQFAEYNEERYLIVCVPTWQTILNLMGKSDDPGVLAGEAMNFDAFLNADKSHMNSFFEATSLFFEMYLAYMFDRTEVAAEKSKAVKKFLSTSSFVPAPRLLHNLFFYDGLTNIDMASSTRDRKWEVEARRSIKRLKKASKKSPQNNLHMYHLLKAEWAVLKGKKKEAAREYDSAIAAAVRVSFCHHEGLAYEKAGIFFKRVGLSEKSTQCFVSAHQCYLKWGAQAKADHLYNCWMCLR